MSSTPFPITPTQLPSGFCPAGYQELLNSFSAHQFVELGDQTGIGVTVSATKPSDQSLPWLMLDSWGRPVRLYFFASGAWLSLHPQVPGTTIIWTTAEANLTTFLQTFDGGSNQALSDLSGPMWEEVTELAARFPIGAGTLPSGTAVPVAGTGGEETHVLTQTELPSTWTGITAVLKAWRTNLETLAGQWLAPPAALGGGPTTPATETGTFTFDNAGGDQGHQNMPPYLGVSFLRRTNRLFYAVT